MSQYIRAQFDHPDDIYFLTIVTLNRHPFFKTPAERQIAIQQFSDLTAQAQGELLAWVIMPDHLHVVLRQGKWTYSRLTSTFKRRMNMIVLNRQGTLWQPRFWEHRVRNEQDLRKYLDYIHANPVLEGIVEAPEDYDASSFQLWVERGEYSEDWCGVDIAEPPWKGGE